MKKMLGDADIGLLKMQTDGVIIHLLDILHSS